MAPSTPTSFTPSPPPPPSPSYTPVSEKPSEAYNHLPTPLHTKSTKTTNTKDKDTTSVSCIKCRPSPRDKTSIVPLSPNILRTLFRRSTPRTSTSSATPSSEDQWKLTASELSRKLLHATRKREEAVLEASRLKYSLAELERQLESRPAADVIVSSGAGTLNTEELLRAVADSRSAIRHLARSLAAQIRHGAAGPRAMDRVMAQLQPYDVRLAGATTISTALNQTQSMLFYLEALLNRVFYSEFEAEEGGAPPDPSARCEAALAQLETVRGVGWEEVLSRGTRHYSEGLSRFCDRRMSEVVGMLAWARAWPEALLQAFFGAAKGAWVVHLIARTVHPNVPILRVEGRAKFNSDYMDDVGGDRARRRVAETVRMMVAPGFYVYSGSSCGVVKCKVLCLYRDDEANDVSEKSNDDIRKSDASEGK